MQRAPQLSKRPDHLNGLGRGGRQRLLPHRLLGTIGRA